MAPEYYGANTRLFWDVEDFPVPEDRDMCSLQTKVKRALRIEGYTGDLSIYAYGGEKTREDQWQHFSRAEISLVHDVAEKHVRLNRMILDVLEWAFHNRSIERAENETNFIVVSKDIPEKNTEFISVLEALTKRDYNVFLAVSDDLPLELVPPRIATSLVWRWTRLFDGMFPIEELDTDSESDADCEEGNSQGARETSEDNS